MGNYIVRPFDDTQNKFLNDIGENQLQNLIKHLAVILNFCHLNKELTDDSHVHKSFKFIEELQNTYRRDYDNVWPKFFEYKPYTGGCWKMNYVQCNRIIFDIKIYYGFDAVDKIMLSALV